MQLIQLADEFATSPTAIRLLDSALDEVLQRAPQYFQRVSVSVQAREVELAEYLTSARASPDEAPLLHAFVERSIAHWQCNGAQFATESVGKDPVGQMLLESAIDAYGAVRGRLGIRGDLPNSLPLAEVLSSAFDERRTPSGARYFIARTGVQPLLLISARGVSLAVWQRLLGDSNHRFRVIIVESRASDIVCGGLLGASEVAEDAREIVEVLQQEGLGDVPVLAWCNGARVALEVCGQVPERVRALALLTPTMAGAAGVGMSGSEFEVNLQTLLRMARKRPVLAPMIAQSLSACETLDWTALQADPLSAAKRLWGLPAQSDAASLSAPVAGGDSLLNYAQCLALDEKFAVHDALERLKLPVLLITGVEDQVVNNDLTLAALNNAQCQVTHVEVRAAGHYINRLQYPYLIWAIEQWFEHGPRLHGAVRASVRSLAARG